MEDIEIEIICQALHRIVKANPEDADFYATIAEAFENGDIEKAESLLMTDPDYVKIYNERRGIKND